MAFTERLKLIDSVPGSLFIGQAEVLYNLAFNSKHSIVEIGTYYGRSTVALGLGSLDSEQHFVFTIDPHVDIRLEKIREIKDGAVYFWKFADNIKRAGVNGIVIPIVGGSAQAFPLWGDHPIGVLFIDDGHGLTDIRRDLKWVKYVVDGGIVAMHDCWQWVGVTCGIVEYLMNNTDLQLVSSVDSLAIFQKGSYSRESINATLYSKFHNKPVGNSIDFFERDPSFIDPWDLMPYKDGEEGTSV